MKIELKLALLWVFFMTFIGVQAQVVTDFDVTYAQELLKPGTPAPDFQLQTPDGKTVKFSEFSKGKYVVIDFGLLGVPTVARIFPKLSGSTTSSTIMAWSFSGFPLTQTKRNGRTTLLNRGSLTRR